MPRFTTRTVFALGFTLVIWASAFAGIRAGLRGYSPANLAILRFLIASLVLVIYAGWRTSGVRNCGTSQDWF